MYVLRLGNQILSVLKRVGIWIRSKFYVELYRGQITVTTRILSPAARHGNDVPSSKAEFKYLRTQAKLSEIIIAASRGELPTTSPFVYATEMRGYAAQFALLERGIVYHLRVPRRKSYKVNQYFKENPFAWEEEWLILHEVKPRWIKAVLSPATIEPFETPVPF